MPVLSRVARGAAILFAVGVAAAATGEAGRQGGATVGDVQARATATSVEITFRTAVASQGVVELGTDASYGVRLRERGTPSTAHRIEVRGLRPGTDYFFRARAKIGSPITAPGVVRTERSFRGDAVATGRTITLDGAPFFPVMTWAQCADEVGDNLALGVNVFMSTSPCELTPEDDLVRRVGGDAFTVMPIGSELGSLGWHQQDEPDGSGIPPDALPDRPSGAGKLTFLTVTAHFAPWDEALPAGRDVYRDYFAKADVIGFDLYPLGKRCSPLYRGLGDVYEEQRALLALTTKPTFQWIETGPLEGSCVRPGWPQLSPARVAAEIWLAIAGGATGIGYFTHAWQGDEWLRYAVSADIAAEIARQNARIAALQPVLLARRPAARVRGDQAVKAGARRYDEETYVIAVNSSERRARVSLAVKGVRPGERLVALRDGHVVRIARDGFFSDSFAPLEVRVYRTA